jgi:membrane fusion protein (multidrug efflux system)
MSLCLRRWRPLLAAGCVGLLLAALAGGPLAGCREGAADAASPGASDAPRATIVDIVELRPELLRNVVEIPGQLTAEMTVELAPEIEGVIESIEFAEGHRVEADQVLLRLRDREQRARLREAQAERDLAVAVYRRTRRLAQSNVSSEAQLERARAELEVARSRVEGAAVELERTLIRAPFGGLMGDLQVAPGDRVTPDDQLVFTLPEIAVGLVEPGIPVSIRVAPYPEKRFEGEVYFVSPTLDAAARRLLIKAWVPNPGHLLRPGLFAEIDAEIERREDALLVPESALLHGLDGTSVWRVDEEDRARRVPVELGLRSAGRVEIVSGLAPGDRVVATGVHKVDPGSLVRAPALPGADAIEAAEDPEPDRRKS